MFNESFGFLALAHATFDRVQWVLAFGIIGIVQRVVLGACVRVRFRVGPQHPDVSVCTRPPSHFSWCDFGDCPIVTV